MTPEEIAKAAATKAGHSAFDNVTSEASGKENPRANIQFILAILILAALSVAFATDIILVKKRGASHVGHVWLYASLGAIGLIGYASVLAFSGFSINFGEGQGTLPVLVTCIFYFNLGLLVFFIGINEASYARKNTASPDAPGEIVFFSSLAEKGYSSIIIYKFIIPLVLLVIGGLFSIGHILLGLPILLASVAYFLMNIGKGLPQIPFAGDIPKQDRFTISA